MKKIAFLCFVIIGSATLLIVNKKDKVIESQGLVIPANSTVITTTKIEDVSDITIKSSVVISVPTITEIIEKPESNIVVNEEAVREGEEKLAILIEEYDQNLFDQEKRKEIEVQASKISESYKKEVLAKVKSIVQNEKISNQP